MVTPHDILSINGVSAALMISPMPFLGPIGAVRIGLIDGEFVINPTLPEAHEDSELDLIVVGTKDGLTMVEAGANSGARGEAPRSARPRAEGDQKLCQAQEDLRAKAGKPKWLDPAVTAQLADKHGAGGRGPDRREGLREAGSIVGEIVDGECGSCRMSRPRRTS